MVRCVLFFFFNDTATTEIYTLSLHDALPICRARGVQRGGQADAGRRRADPLRVRGQRRQRRDRQAVGRGEGRHDEAGDRKSTRLNSSHANISYAVFCLKKKKITYYN